jgi:hypothetical protein
LWIANVNVQGSRGQAKLRLPAKQASNVGSTRESGKLTECVAYEQLRTNYPLKKARHSCQEYAPEKCEVEMGHDFSHAIGTSLPSLTRDPKMTLAVSVALAASAP